MPRHVLTPEEAARLEEMRVQAVRGNRIDSAGLAQMLAERLGPFKPKPRSNLSLFSHWNKVK